MICQNCGNQLENNAGFCTRCGSMVSTPQPMGMGNGMQPEYQVENTKQKKKGFKIGIIIGVVVAFLLLVIVIVMVLMAPKKETNDRGKKEKEIKEYEYDDKRYWDEYEKDDRGNLIQGINYDEDDYEVERCEWEYDEDDDVIIERKYSYLKDKNVAGFCEYDGHGDLLKEAKYSYDRYGKVEEYDEYDVKGNKIKEVVYQGEDNIVAWTEWEYDESGNVTKVISCNADGNVGGWIEYVYDSNGIRIKESTYNSNGHTEIHYDDWGNKIKEERYNSDGERIEWVTYRYDAKGNCLEKIYYNILGTVVEWCSWEYDTEGHRIKENIHHSDGSLDMGYEYDTNGKQIRIIDYDTESKDVDWKKAFREYLTHYESESGCTWIMFHLDNDGIPELYKTNASMAEGSSLLYYSAGKIKEEILWLDAASYIEKTGILYSWSGRDTDWGSVLYRLKNGNLEKIGEGNYYTKWQEEADDLIFTMDENGNVIYYDGSHWNGHPVTRDKEYEALENKSIQSLGVNRNQLVDINGAEEDTDAIIKKLSDEKKDFDIQKCDELKGLLSSYAYFIGDGTWCSETEAMEKINRICQGDRDAILEFWGWQCELPTHWPPVDTITDYDYNLVVCNYVMNYEQMEYAAYSLCGKEIKFADIDYPISGCLGFGGCAGSMEGNWVESLRVLQIKNNTWRVEADVWHGAYYEDDTRETKVAEISFIVCYDPDSCYNGYRVTGVEKLKYVN